jgi:two-component system, LytTR family, response regulator
MGMAAHIRAVIVDDEALAREAIRFRLLKEPDIEIVGEAADGPDAVQLVHKVQPDVLFLDIQMPEMDGFEVIESIAAAHLPIVVFVTAYDRYALKAFETHAMDYLLKPFTATRFAAAVDRVRLEVANAGDPETHLRLMALLDERRQARQLSERHAAKDYLDRFAVKHNQRFVLVKADDVDWIESSGNYARLHAKGVAYIVRMKMSELERRLDQSRFARIHRSTIVQIDRIKDMLPVWHGDFDVTLRDGTVLRLTRSYRGRLLPSRQDR